MLVAFPLNSQPWNKSLSTGGLCRARFFGSSFIEWIYRPAADAHTHTHPLPEHITASSSFALSIPVAKRPRPIEVCMPGPLFAAHQECLFSGMGIAAAAFQYDTHTKHIKAR